MEVLALRDRDETCELENDRWAPAQLKRFETMGPAAFGYSPRLNRTLRRSRAALAHLHGLWKYPAIAVWRWSWRTGLPYVVSPHGMLEPWALTRSRFKKRLATLLYQGPCLRSAKCIRVTSRLELESVRAAGYKSRFCLIPNGVEVPVFHQEERLARRRPRRALFLSRIHPKKGLLNLIRAWERSRPVGWQVVVAGPDENGHRAEAQKMVRERGLEKVVVFVGEAWGEERSRLYREAELFVLPSFSENFGLVIAEALAYGVPVITTRATPWEELVTERCGWWVSTGMEALVPALNEATHLAEPELRARGARGRRLIERKYTWEPIGRQMHEVYEWMLGRRPPPPSLEAGD